MCSLASNRHINSRNTKTRKKKLTKHKSKGLEISSLNGDTNLTIAPQKAAVNNGTANLPIVVTMVEKVETAATLAKLAQTNANEFPTAGQNESP